MRHWMNTENRPLGARRPHRSVVGYSGDSGLTPVSVDDLVRRPPEPPSFNDLVAQAKHKLAIWDEGHGR